MKKALLLFACGLLTLGLLGCAEQAAEVTAPINHAPQLLSLTAERTIVGLGESTPVTASARDPDNDNLTFSWLATAGQIEGTGNQITWTAPDDFSDTFIRCQVSDGRGGTDAKSVEIRSELDSPPTITALSVQPTVIRSTGGTATITAHVVDRIGTGVASVAGTISLAGSVVADLSFGRVSGDNQEGDYQATWQVPANGSEQPQTYEVNATAVDAGGHSSVAVGTTFSVEAIASPPPPPT